VLIPEQIVGMNPVVCAIGAVSLFLLFFISGILSRIKQPWTKFIPVPLVVISLAAVTAWLLELPEQYLIHVPADLFEHGITFPHFDTVFSTPDLYWPLLLTVITLTLIDATESLTTIQAIDKIDPFKRKSNPNVTLRAMGVSNTASSLLGGLTIIHGGMKSTTNMLVGARTLWANFYYALFQLLFLLFATSLINHIPKSALAGLLIWVGWKLCSHKVFMRIFAVGKEQMFIAFVTIVVTLYTADLLDGMIVGTATKIILLVKDVIRASAKDSMMTDPTPCQPDADNLAIIRGMPIKELIIWLMHHARHYSVPSLKEKMHVPGSVIDWQSRTMEFIDCRAA
jgi:carbonic anhydrase